MMHFTPGKEVSYNGLGYTVEYVSLRGFDLFVKLVNMREPINATQLYCEPTEFTTERV